MRAITGTSRRTGVMRGARFLNAATVLLLVALRTTAHAQSDGPYIITASVVAGGGSTAGASPDFSVSVTIGQPLAGQMMSMAGGEYAVASGFWPVQEAEVPTPTPSGTIVATTIPTPTLTGAPMPTATTGGTPPTGSPTAAAGMTVTPTPSTVQSAAPTNTPTPTPSPTIGPCVGDCSGDKSVTVDELVTLTDVALGDDVVTACPNRNVSHDSSITVSDILMAVNSASNGCI